MDARVVQDVAAMAALVREAIGDPDAPVALRGSSMGGLLAILAAPRAAARAVVAICPASASGLRRGIAAGRFGFAADRDALDALLDVCDLPAVVASLTGPLLILHAEGDEQVPIAHSQELATHMRAAGSRLITVPGGHHRSIQHDGEMQAVSLRFIARSLG
jgi:alpha-beta hydrolase superfamily lysophospholipase